MRLFLVAQQFRNPWSGLGTYTRALIPALRDRGHEVVLAAPGSQCDPDAGVECRPMAFEPGNLTPFSRRRMAREVRKALAAVPEGTDLVHFLDAREAALVGSLKGLPPVVGSVHDSYALDWRSREHPRKLYDDRRKRGLYYAWLRGVERRAYSSLTRLAANCRYVADAINAGYGLDPERVEAVQLGLPVLDPPEPLPLAGTPSVLFVGAGYRRKGLPVLRDAVESLRPALPEILVHVVGPELHEQSLVCHGRQPPDAVRSIMAGADILAVPSHVEAVGLVYLEAMREGTPVVGTTQGGTPEYLTDGEDCLLVPPGDATALAAAIRRLATDNELRDRLAAAGRETVRRYSVESMAEATERFYGAGVRS